MPKIKPEIIRTLRELAEFEQDGGNAEQGAAIDIILDWYDRQQAALKPTEAPVEDGWIEWNGGECPVDPQTEVYWRRRFEAGKPAADMENEFKAAGDLRWTHRGSRTDIIAYRLAASTKEE